MRCPKQVMLATTNARMLRIVFIHGDRFVQVTRITEKEVWYTTWSRGVSRRMRCACSHDHWCRLHGQGQSLVGYLDQWWTTWHLYRVCEVTEAER